MLKLLIFIPFVMSSVMSFLFYFYAVLLKYVFEVYMWFLECYLCFVSGQGLAQWLLKI